MAVRRTKGVYARGTQDWFAQDACIWAIRERPGAGITPAVGMTNTSSHGVTFYIDYIRITLDAANWPIIVQGIGMSGAAVAQSFSPNYLNPLFGYPQATAARLIVGPTKQYFALFADGEKGTDFIIERNDGPVMILPPGFSLAVQANDSTTNAIAVVVYFTPISEVAPGAPIFPNVSS